jgi:hypothetical protein
MKLKGKIVHNIEEHKHKHYNYPVRIEITFTDGTVLEVSHHGSGNSIDTKITKGDPPKEKVVPWKQHEINFIAKLSQEDKEAYATAREAFFWLLDNHEKVRSHYSYFDKNWREMRPSFSMCIDKEKDEPEAILTIFFSSHVTPECDDWFELGLKRDWKRIIEMKEEVEKGKQ